ncbi:MAG: WD40/YVTN/BNR-like repeat-containing protein [Blastocatellia bacterium]
MSDSSFLIPDTGYALFQGQLYMTSDSCRTWNPVDLPKSVSADQVYFADEDHGWVVGQDGSLITTTNGGLTWTNVSYLTAGGRTFKPV